MASPSSSGEDARRGIVVLVNAYLSKTDVDEVLRPVFHGHPLQAYILHSSKQPLGNDASQWDKPSNTLGIVLAHCQMDLHLQSTYPRACRTDMVIHFIQNVSLDNGFPETPFKRISEFNSPSSRNLYKGLITAVYEYQRISQGRRGGARYAGRSIGELEGMMQGLRDGRSDSDNEERGGLQENAFGSASTMARPRRMASDLVAEHEPSAPWPDVEDWIREHDNSSGVRETAPEELGEDVSTSVLLALCRDQLKEVLTQAIRGSAIRGVIACVHIDSMKPQHSKKQRRVNEA